MNKFYQNKSVVLTGHTGINGSWLVALLKLMGTCVIGIAHDPPSSPNHFNATGLANNINVLLNFYLF
jgi:CDP-glucose 4,6-dehydratase